MKNTILNAMLITGLITSTTTLLSMERNGPKPYTPSTKVTTQYCSRGSGSSNAVLSPLVTVKYAKPTSHAAWNMVSKPIFNNPQGSRRRDFECSAYIGKIMPSCQYKPSAPTCAYFHRKCMAAPMIALSHYQRAQCFNIASQIPNHDDRTAWCERACLNPNSTSPAINRSCMIDCQHYAPSESVTWRTHVDNCKAVCAPQPCHSQVDLWKSKICIGKCVLAPILKGQVTQQNFCLEDLPA